MSDSKKFPSRKVLACCLALLICLGPLGYAMLSAKALQAAGEFMALDDIITHQQDTGATYGPALFNRSFYYRQALHRHIQPSLVVLGSAAAQTLHAESFTTSFANLSGTDSLQETGELAKAIVKDHIPDTTIIALDFSWFHPMEEDRVMIRDPATVSAQQLAFINPALLQKLGNYSGPNKGVTAITTQSGFRPDGSFDYTGLLTGAAKPRDIGFDDTLDALEDGQARFARANDISDKQWRKLYDLILSLQAQGVKVVIYLPPLAPKVANALEASSQHRYVQELRKRLRDMAAELDIALFDNLNPAAVQAQPCEFIDGVTPGDIASARVLFNMAIANETLRKAVRLPETALALRTYEGHAFANDKNWDFLGLGCKKKEDTHE